MRGMAHASGQDPDSGTRVAATTGGATGNNVGSYQADEFKAHTHGGIPLDAGGIYGSGTARQASSYYGTLVYTSSTGGNETRPRNTYIDYIIRYL